MNSHTDESKHRLFLRAVVHCQPLDRSGWQWLTPCHEAGLLVLGPLISLVLCGLRGEGVVSPRTAYVLSGVAFGVSLAPVLLATARFWRLRRTVRLDPVGLGWWVSLQDPCPAPGSVHVFGHPRELEAIAKVNKSTFQEITVVRLHQPEGVGSYGLLAAAIGAITILVCRRVPAVWPLGYLAMILAVPLRKLLGVFRQWFAPSCYRVRSGLLEIIEGKEVATSCQKVVPLSGSCLVIHYGRGCVLLYDGSQSHPKHVIPLQGIADAHLLTRALAWAVLFAENREKGP